MNALRHEAQVALSGAESKARVIEKELADEQVKLEAVKLVLEQETQVPALEILTLPLASVALTLRVSPPIVGMQSDSYSRPKPY